MSDETKARIAEIEARARRTIAGCCDVDATGCDDREHLDARTDLWWRSVLTAETRRADDAEARAAKEHADATVGGYWHRRFRAVEDERDAATARAERAEKELAETRADRDVAESCKSEAFHRLHARAAAAESSLAAYAKVVEAARKVSSYEGHADGVSMTFCGFCDLPFDICWARFDGGDCPGHMVRTALAALPADEGGGA